MYVCSTVAGRCDDTLKVKAREMPVQYKYGTGTVPYRYGTPVKDDSRVWQRSLRDGRNSYFYIECRSVRPQLYCSGVHNCRQRGKEWQR